MSAAWDWRAEVDRQRAQAEPPAFAWTDETVAKLRRLAEQGLSSPEIAAAMDDGTGKPSRSAIMSKIKSQGIQLKNAGGPRAPRATQVPAQAWKPEAVAEVEAAIADLARVEPIDVGALLNEIRAARDEAIAILTTLRQAAADVSLPMPPERSSWETAQRISIEADADLREAAAEIDRLKVSLSARDAEIERLRLQAQELEQQRDEARLAKPEPAADAAKALKKLQAVHSATLADLTTALMERNAALAERDRARAAPILVGGSSEREAALVDANRLLADELRKLKASYKEGQKINTGSEKPAEGMRRLVLEVPIETHDKLFEQSVRRNRTIERVACDIIKAGQRFGR